MIEKINLFAICIIDSLTIKAPLSQSALPIGSRPRRRNSHPQHPHSLLEKFKVKTLLK
jgi:hypothetical protein